MADEANEVRLPLLEEKARIAKRQVERERLRVSKTVHEREEALEALLSGQDVSVERVPLNTPVSAPPPVREEGEFLIIPVVEEVLVVEKRLVLREEIRIRRQERSRPATQRVRLRREEVAVERLPPAPSPAPPSPAQSEPFREGSFDIPVMGEEAVVEKEMRVREEVVIRKTETERTETVNATLRHTEAEVQDGQKPPRRD